jgi:hypothetical protein
MSKSCSKCAGVGSTGGSPIDIETLLIIGGGAVAAMAMVNPLGKAIWKDKIVPNWFSLLTKTGIGFGLVNYGKHPVLQLMGIGAIAVACVEGVKFWKPDVFNTLLPAGGAASDNVPVPKGVGEGGFNVINLNDPQWQVNAVGNYGGGGATAYQEYEEAVSGPDSDDSAI